MNMPYCLYCETIQVRIWSVFCFCPEDMEKRQQTATNEGLDAAGHAIGTAWTAFKIRKAINPKSVIKPSTLAKSAAKAAAAEMKAKKK
ncbi:hypothetical protein Dsin_011367 [Dipteronia sinensis]|uniref:Senescence domain-containing protein n=1 Tax=Dipteronia sinensis TaxID=43782 RepID=A0AAE0AUG8_9ROSI|nr:hypothetical protein Dsin_011367 [Dipteronia sinensis]